MRNVANRFVLGVIFLVLFGQSTNASMFSLERNKPLLITNPPLEAAFIHHRPIYVPLQGSIIFLPIIMNPPARWYAQAEHFESIIYGVWASIQTPNPVIREPYFSYASINIISPDGKWIETGIRKMSPDCVPRFVHAIQPAEEVTVLLSPLPTIGVSYQYKIEKHTDGLWTLYIMQTNGTVIYSTYIDNLGMNYGTSVQVSGEVNSPAKLNDLGISNVTSLKWKMVNGNWGYWNGWVPGIVNFPPYWVEGIAPDGSNNVCLSGNNGSPVPPNAPCP